MRSDISHLHLPSNPKQINCVVLCEKINKQTKQHSCYFPHEIQMIEGVVPLSYVDKWFCQCNKKRKNVLCQFYIFLFFYFFVWCLTNMCWVSSWERNEIKEAQGVSKSKRLIGAVISLLIYGGQIFCLMRHPLQIQLKRFC